MVITKAKRKEAEDHIFKVFSTLDSSGKNTAKYKNMFKAMSDEQFAKYMTQFFKDDNQNFYLEILPWENEPKLKDIEKAAKIVNLELHKYIYTRDHGNKDNPIRTRYRVPFGYIHIKRLQQILTKKTGFTTDINQRNALTNQLSGDAAVGRIADEETIALATIDGTDNILKELLGARADNRDKRIKMYQNIQRDGYVNNSELEGDVRTQGTLNYLDVVLTGAGFRTDLVNSTGILRNTQEK